MRLVDKLLDKCERDGVLEKEEEDIIRFGIENLINLVICLGILLCIGWIFDSLLSGILFFMFFSHYGNTLVDIIQILKRGVLYHLLQFYY